MSRRKDDTTAPLEEYIQRSLNTQEALSPFGTDRLAASASAEEPATPTLRKGRRNRIIYYIGSFNPPHLGHLALIEHVFSNANVDTSAPSSSSPDDPDAIALIVVLHGESWIQRKLRKAPYRSGGKTPLHLEFKQRYRLVRQGIPEDLVRKGVWVFPEDQGEWRTFQGRLERACQEDGFAVEFLELLGPDYVKQQKPQCSGNHGVITSNISRRPDFVVASVDGQKLVDLGRFGPWERVGPNKEAAGSGARGTDENAEKDNSVWVCRHVSRKEYRIWFVQHANPTMDSDLSSTALRRIVAESRADELNKKLGEVAMSPGLLLNLLKKHKSKC